MAAVGKGEPVIRAVTRTRSLRVGVILAVLAAAATYILLKIDVHRTVHVIGAARPLWVLLAAALTLVTVVPMAWRWQLLLRARGIDDTVPWLTRAYLVGFAVGQVLPTSVGGDASRIYETARRHPGRVSPIAGSVLLERALGGAVTLVLAAVGFVLAIGRYSIGAYLWVEVLFVFGTIALAIVFFSRRLRTRLSGVVPLARKLRAERVARAVYEGIHGYRDHPGTVALVSATTVVVQACGILAIWAAGRAVGVHVSLLAYVVLGPLVFLVMLVPFTINGLGVREAFFVSFLGRLHVPADTAFACGFLYFLMMTLVLAPPGLVVILFEMLRRSLRRSRGPARTSAPQGMPEGG